MAKINNSKNNTILSGSGTADSIYNTGDNVTIYAGAGHDLISLNSGAANNVIIYKDGDGLDTVCGFDENDTLQISGSYSTQKSGSNIVVNVGNGKILLKNVTSLKSINTTSDDQNSTLATFNNSSAAKVTLASGVEVGDASSRTKAIRIMGNALANSILGGSGKDTILGSDGDDYLFGDNDNDSISGDAGNDTLSGGAGNDTLTGGAGKDVFIYSGGDDNDVITDYAEEDKIKFASGTISNVAISGNDVIFTVDGNKLIVKDAAKKILTCEDEGVEIVFSLTTPVTVNSAGTSATLLSNYTAEKFDVNSNAYVTKYASKLKTIDASAVQFDLDIIGNSLANKIIGSGKDNFIQGGSGKDTILGGDGNDSIDGGAGNDSLSGGEGADVFIYNNGDGNDVITDYAEEDIIQVNGKVSKVATSGKNVIMTIGNGKITVTGGADKTITYVDLSGKYAYPELIVEPFIIDGKKVTLLEEYTDASYSIADTDKLQTVDASKVQRGISIAGNVLANRIIGSENDDYISGGEAKDTILGGDGNDTINGGAGNDSLSGGNGADIFVYKSGDGNDVITDYAAEDRISISGGKVSKIAPSSKNVIMTVGSNKITITGGKDKAITYVDSSGEHVYPEVVKFTEKGATLLAGYSKDSFNINDYDEYKDTNITINAAAVQQDIAITANAKANRIIGSNENDYIDASSGKDTILGGDGNDTLIGGKGNDSLSGGDGADIFVYNSGDGNDVITDYAEEDRIQIAAGTISKIAPSGKNVIMTIGSGKITVSGGADKIIAYVDAKGVEHFYPVDFNSSGTSATLLSSYAKKTFDAADYGNYADTLKIINGSKVTHDIAITGNSNANQIIGSTSNDYLRGQAGKDTLVGGDGNDTLCGGIGNDSLIGGDGTDVFIYAEGDGNDVITDYAKGEKISITSGIAKASASGNNLILTVGAGKVTVKDAVKNKVTVTYWDDDGKHTYKPSSKDLLLDDNYSFDAAQLSTIIKPDSASYTSYDFAINFNLIKEDKFIPVASKRENEGANYYGLH